MRQVLHTLLFFFASVALGNIPRAGKAQISFGSYSQLPAYGRVNGPSTVKATLDGVSVGTTILGTNGGQWRATLDLTPGTHQLSVTAHHTSGQFSTNAVSWFTNSAATDRAINGFDAAGQLTHKVWLSSNGTTNRTQNLYWDAKGRLWKVVERDSGIRGMTGLPFTTPVTEVSGQPPSPSQTASPSALSQKQSTSSTIQWSSSWKSGFHTIARPPGSFTGRT